ncbi:unnamed protein product [Ilex paraguariensis]|uniref:Dof zinc finger protein n=1 Tax=Ilex paraguariensis TaxID=185542 RepID=A0ABC8UQ58_9AQUA
MEKAWRPNVEISPPCPRCGSSNTKFCYYNNYSLTQPRYFCKSCRRYWTKGGSLRNVPVGGGCRKSRRGKSIRLSTDGVSSRSLAYRSTPCPNGTSLDDFTNSSMGPDGPNIDLAMVYANFLNQPPEPDTQVLDRMLELPRDINPSFELASASSNIQKEFSTHLPQENGIVEHVTLPERSSEIQLSDSDSIYLFGLRSIQNEQETIQQFLSTNQMNYSGFPSLPGEEIASEEIMWSNSHIMVQNHMFHATQPPGNEPEVSKQNLLIDSRSPFDFPSCGTFFRP